ncbi:WD40 repeat domain-containing protein [Aporhodopirellula aestuarii]|uniref:WD40 repeat domain-containing protein n=1 Tax=Aporhodopirellula aestuarii TaxID=2950107 RepID=A0ABT0U5Y1_9BACT|nr:hypothetical protein [Aporhodopirellula aestuarii]MCM2372331.1 hypothetical protein [Aporhodopirellula aestuarii]
MKYGVLSRVWLTLICLYLPLVCVADDGTNTWHTSEVTGLIFTPDGVRLISTSLRNDRVSKVVPGENSLESIDGAAGKITGVRSHAIAITPDGSQVAIAGFKSTAVYDLKTRQELWRISTTAEEYSPPYVMALAFSPDGRQLATSGASSKVGGPHGYKGGLITIRDAKSGRELRRFDDLSHASDSIAFSPDGKLFAAGTHGAGGELPEPGELRVWDVSNGMLLHLWKLKDSVQPGEERFGANGIAFSPDSRNIAVAYSDGIVRIWDVATRKTRIEMKGHRRGVRRVAFSPDGQRIASGGLDRTVRLWETGTGRQIQSFDISAAKVNTLVFSPDGDRLVAGGGDFLRSGEIQIWQLPNPNR